MNKIEKLIDQLSELTLIQASELVTKLEKKWGGLDLIKPPTHHNNKTDIEQEEKKSYKVILQEIGKERIKIIKIVKEITGLGLRESKNKVEAINISPIVIKDNISKKLAEEIKSKFIASGAKAVIE